MEEKHAKILEIRKDIQNPDIDKYIIMYNHEITDSLFEYIKAKNSKWFNYFFACVKKKLKTETNETITKQLKEIPNMPHCFVDYVFEDKQNQPKSTEAINNHKTVDCE